VDGFDHHCRVFPTQKQIYLQFVICIPHVCFFGSG
jgi:hypothetical protein